MKRCGDPWLTRRCLLNAAVLAGTGFAAGNAEALPFELRVLAADDGAATRQIMDVMMQRVSPVHVSTDARSLAQRRGPTVYAALGPAAFQSALDAELNGPLLCLFTSNEAFTRLLGGAARRPRMPVSAIFAECSPMQQMALARALYQRRIGVGAMLTANTAYQESALRRAARANDLDLEVQTIAPGDNVVRALTRFRSAAAVLTVPDPDLYSAATFRGILEGTYRRGQGVIGFSSGLVSAGALAGAYATIDDVLAQVSDVAISMMAGRTPEPQHPLYWRVAINERVASSLDIVVTDAARALGNPPPP